MHLSEIWHSKKNDSRLSRTQVKRCIFNVFNFYKPQKRYESATMEDAILNTQICFVIKCHIPIRCIPPQKELNQVKNEIFSHLQFF